MNGTNCATPIVHGDNVLLASNVGTQLLKITANGPESVWNKETPERGKGPCHADPVILGETVYEFTGFPMDEKTLRCLALKDGAELWNAELGAGWLLPIDGHLLCLSNSGKLVLLKPNAAKFEKVTEFQAITGHPVWTAPVVAGERLYLRCKANLICYQLK
jgi:outer membrane protein assembly factor BamB